MLLFSIHLPLILTSCTKEKVIHRACPKGRHQSCYNWHLEVWNYVMKFLFVVYARSWHEQSIAILSRACSFVGVSLCFISQCVRKHYLMMFNLILCSIFRDKSFSQMRRESEICNATAILEVSGKLNLLMNLNRVTLIVLGFFELSFSHWFYKGSVRGSVGGQLTGGQCFVETPHNTLNLVWSVYRVMQIFAFGVQTR